VQLRVANLPELVPPYYPAAVGAGKGRSRGHPIATTSHTMAQ